MLKPLFDSAPVPAVLRSSLPCCFVVFAVRRLRARALTVLFCCPPANRVASRLHLFCCSVRGREKTSTGCSR